MFGAGVFACGRLNGRTSGNDKNVKIMGSGIDVDMGLTLYFSSMFVFASMEALEATNLISDSSDE